MAIEFSGDGGMSVAQRLRYLWANFIRNLGGRNVTFDRLCFCAARLQRTPSAASPGRALTEAFLGDELPCLLPQRDIRVLEIGCGSGSLVRMLSEAGYRGTYVGIDVADRFERGENASFDRTFVCSDAHLFEPRGRFDLVISISALEHIPDDRRLIRRLSDFVAPGGMQLHFVPSAWGLPAYLWHGYRQYSLAALGERFDAKRMRVYSMGGVPSFLLHLFFITLGETLARLGLRRRLPLLYRGLLDRCLRLDRYLPYCAVMHAVCLTASPVAEDPHG